MAWWYLSMNRYFDSPEVMKEIRLTRKAAQEVFDAPDVPFASGVCMIRDERSMFMVTAEQSALMDRPNSPLHAMQFEISGVPYDVHSLDDFAAGKVSENYSVYCFIHHFRKNRDAEAQVEKLKKLGKTLVFVYSPGYENCGFKVEKLPGYRRVRGELAKNHPLTRGVRPLTSCIELFLDSLDLKRSNKFYAGYQAMRIIDAGKGEILARYQDGSTAAAIRKDGKAALIVLTEPFSLSAGLLNNIARYAGAYVLCPSGAVGAFFNGKFLSCHAVRNGKVTFALPGNISSVKELLTENGGDFVKIENGSMTLELTAGETRWFLLQ
jgi:hypothetical protein